MKSAKLDILLSRHLASFLRIGLSALIILVFVLHAMGTPRFGWIERLENLSYDVRLRFNMPEGVDERIVIANIDEPSLAELGRWPWPRDILAEMVDTLFEHYQIRTLGFDVVFAEPDTDAALSALDDMATGALRNDPDFQAEYQRIRGQLDRDGRFAESVADRPVVTGFIFDQRRDQEHNILPPAIFPLPEAVVGHLSLVRPSGYTGNLEPLQKSAAAGGFFDNPRVDADGVYRRAPLVQEYQGALYESLSLAIARLALDDPAFSVRIDDDPDYRFVDELRLGSRRIPLEAMGSALVPYRGYAGSYPYVSIKDVLAREIDPEILEDRIVLVGTTAPGLLDLRTTPLQSVYPGVEVHANLVAGILDGTLMYHPPWILAVELFLVLALGLISNVLAMRFSPMLSFLAIMSLVAATLTINHYAWQQGMVLPLASPILVVISLFALHTLLRLFNETKDRLVLARLFGQYIPPELVDEMSQHPEDISLEGKNKELTVLFSDVRGFTSISEGLEPEALTQLMNELLTPMTRVIHQHRGTIDKYMGDAIMAFWGAPLDDPNHARNALLAALDIIACLDEINRTFKARRWPAVNVGVGLNTGPMSVGNMGSEFRMAYTVLGDAVNLGSRLEGLTKAYGVNIIVSDSTRDAVPDFAFRDLDLVRVKGKEEPVGIFEPLGPASSLSEQDKQQLDRYHEALACYRQQQWDKADALFLSLRGGDPSQKIYSIYLERIGEFRKNPPPADWDGVFTHTSK